MITYIYKGFQYQTLEEAQQAAMQDNPTLLDDELSDYFDDNIEEEEEKFLFNIIT